MKSIEAMSRLLARSKERSFCELHRVDERAFSRTRKLDCGTVVDAILGGVKRSLSIECEMMAANPSKQSFSKARCKIKQEWL